MSKQDTPGGQASPQAASRPNIVLILVDDMGYSDIGCFGSEIDTPNLDRLAQSGVRFSQMYNCARCCPTRASLLTGLYPHQAGVGHMVGNHGYAEYQGFLRDDCVTLAEALRPCGYRTLMSGKWHVGGAYQANQPDSWAPGSAGHPLPVQRGFDEHYGMLGGGGSYFNPPYMVRDDRLIRVGGEGYYLTDAISAEAVRMIEQASDGDQPFLLYVAYTAPHWPLHAPEDDIERYRGRYRLKGWDGVRKARYERLQSAGLLDPGWSLSPRDTAAPAWNAVAEKDWEDLRMAVYAAQVDRMDQGVGRIMDALERQGIGDDTLVMFLSDNGGCAEFLAEDSNRKEPFRYDIPTPDGRPMRLGNTPSIQPGPDDTFASYDLPWANASNTPFRLYKHWVHEGGITTPLLVQWPGGGLAPGIVHRPSHVIDIMATCLEVAGARYPAERDGITVTPLEGESLVPLLRGRDQARVQPLFWEHEGNCALRDGEWKLVKRHPEGWELYNMERDRTELEDMAAREPDRVKRMSAEYRRRAAAYGVRDWPLRR